MVSPVGDVGSWAAGISEGTKVERPTLVFFRWSVTEEGIRIGGRGVARVEPPYRARLDLFLENGEAVAQAVLIDDDLRLPVTLPGGILPPAHLLWGTLGVFRSWPGTEILGAEDLEDGSRRLRTRLATGDQVHYSFVEGTLRWVALLDGGTEVKRVRLEHDGAAVPSRAVYRDLAAFRELIITRESVEHVASFPPDIWRP
ncbi:MAG: hypothetical protein JSU98_11145 [Gemmatimonadales bacterium]|nr:MAG: hypothetical protein JSU98_11145 [Gemmatimonadales bacterium]